MRKTASLEVKAPGKYDTLRYSIFLGGAIDQGAAQDWQTIVARSLDDLDVLVLNPRRDDWDSTWEQTADNPQFREQVEWEIKAQEDADMVIYVFTAESKAPITFFEMGAWGTKKDCVVVAEDGFYRQGNLDIYCEHFAIPIYHSLDDMLIDLHTAIRERA
jgi:hypothetical protein